MTAGAICPPTIVPLRLPVPGKTKLWIDTNTRIELKSDTPDTTFWYTYDGTRPEPFKQLGMGEKTTLKYREPFTLPEGKVAVKALALSRDGRESSVVTKTFQVDYVAPPPLPRDEDDQENFQRDMERDRRKKQETARKESHNLIGQILKKTLQEGGDASAHMGDLRIEGRADMGDLRIEEGRAHMGDLRIEGRAHMGDLRIEGRADMGDLRIEGRAHMGDLRIEGRADMGTSG
ncbi:metal ion binding [Branchiostoma belcheri]|nr:metal ion binding [Branchiostoma belcheri]